MGDVEAGNQALDPTNRNAKEITGFKEYLQAILEGVNKLQSTKDNATNEHAELSNSSKGKAHAIDKSSPSIASAGPSTAPPPSLSSGAVMSSKADSSAYQTAAETSNTLTSADSIDVSHLTKQKSLVAILREMQSYWKELHAKSEFTIFEMGFQIDF